MRFIGLCLIAWVVATAAGCRKAAPPDEPKTSVKGWELYCWKQAGEWGFALLTGTNRLKSDGEIGAVRVDLDGILAELSKLAQGQTVVLGHNAQRNQPPPERIRAAILECCRAGGLETLLW